MTEHGVPNSPHTDFDGIIRSHGARFRMAFAVRSVFWRCVHGAPWASGLLSVGCLFGAPASVIEHGRPSAKT